MDYTTYILKECIPVIVALNILGYACKKIPKIPDWSIVFVLMVLSPILTFGVMAGEVGWVWNLAHVSQAILQGIMCAGTAVYANQIVKQTDLATSINVVNAEVSSAATKVESVINQVENAANLIANVSGNSQVKEVVSAAENIVSGAENVVNDTTTVTTPVADVTTPVADITTPVADVTTPVADVTK